MNQKYFLYKVDFTEHEKGWGLRPDDFILALTATIANEVIKDVESKRALRDCITADFSPCAYEVTKEIYDFVSETEEGFKWFFREQRNKYGVPYGKTSPFML